jgi:hypothetical protein
VEPEKTRDKPDRFDWVEFEQCCQLLTYRARACHVQKQLETGPTSPALFHMQPCYSHTTENPNKNKHICYVLTSHEIWVSLKFSGSTKTVHTKKLRAQRIRCQHHVNHLASPKLAEKRSLFPFSIVVMCLLNKLYSAILGLCHYQHHALFRWLF